ncbi:MAG: divalent metal cation transporter [Cytophagales bacterium]|nr:divalent metal cation transporter [Cytophagales bacterium]
MKARKTLSSVVVWSLISAAFIGPGTITTAIAAGATYHLDLLWAVVFSTLACLLLQEVSARLAIVSGLSMGQALIKKHGEQRGRLLGFVLGGPVIFGCMAYEAGNILGAVSGLQLLIPLDVKVGTLVLTGVVASILWTDRRVVIGWLMTALVGLMGIAFFVLAIDQDVLAVDLLKATITPRVPPGSELLALGLIGTTIVPYNIFLGSGVSRGQTVSLMRIGLSISVLIGGVITAAILVAGTAVESFSSFEELAQVLSNRVGDLGATAIGIGLFAAGISSAITSPYAASIIATSVFSWEKRGQRLVWLLVVGNGFLFGISGMKPIPVILTVQALNGLVLPLLTAFLILLINDPAIIPDSRRHALWYNVVLTGIFGGVLFMGLHSVDRSISTWLGLPQHHFELIITLTTVLTGVLIYRLVHLLRSR